MSDRSSPARLARWETLESRVFLSSAQDITGLTALRQDSNYGGVDGSGVGIAVIDSGVYASHPDLRNNFAGYVDAVRNRFDRVAVVTAPSGASDPEGHGTHTAGIAASSNPQIGVATAARFVSIRGLPSDGERLPQFDTVDNSLQWVLANYQQFNIKVVNMSLGDYTTNFNAVPGGTRPDVFNELEALGISVVISSGNNYGNFASPGSASPGIYGTFTVGNTWPDNGPTADFPVIGGNGNTVDFFAGENDAAPDRIAATSQRSTLPNQVLAPGEEILSTWNSPTKLYNRLSGTSMSAPFVSGMVALMQDAAFTYGGRYLTVGEVQSIVRSTADTVVDADVSSNFRVPVAVDDNGQVFRTGPNQNLPETHQSFRRVNLYRAVQAVRSLVTGSAPAPTPAPTPPPAGTDPNNTTANAVVVPPLDATRQFTFTGNVGTDGSVSVGANDVDLFRVDLESPGVVTFATGPVGGGATFDAFLRLFDAGGHPIAAADDTSGAYPTLQSVRLPAGRYYFGVSSFNNTAYDIATGAGAANGQSQGDYSLRVGLSNPDPNGVVQGATLVNLKDPDPTRLRNGAAANFYQGVIASDPDPINPGSRIQIGDTDVDMYQAVAPDDGVLTVRVEALASAHPVDGVDSFVRVYRQEADGSLTDVGSNDDVAQGNTDSLLEVDVEEGVTYFVAVTTFGNRDFNPTDPFDRVSTTGNVGTYDAYLSFSNGDADGTVFTARPGTVGRAVNGTIGEDGGEPLLGADFGDKDVDFFEFTVPNGGLFDVSVSNTDDLFVPAMTLWRFNVANQGIERVRDAGGGDGARVIAQAAPGEVFFVSVTGAGNNNFNWYAQGSGSGGDTGDYALRADVRPLSDLPTIVNDSIQNGTPEAVNLGDALFRNLGNDGGLERGSADVDLYRFVASTTGPAVIRAGAPGEATTDPFLRVFDANGNELAFNDDAADNTRDAAITLNVTAGTTYYIGVNGSGDGARGYDPVTGAGAAAADEGDYVLSVLPPGSAVGGDPALAERSVGFAGKFKAVFTDADGDVVTLALKGPGTGTVFFDAAAGDHADPRRLVLSDTTGATTLSIKGSTTVGEVIVNGSLKGFGSRTLNLRGNLTVSGSAPKLALGDAAGGTITLGSGAAVTITANSFTDVSLTSGAAIKGLKLIQWLDADATPDALTAPSLASLTAKGDFGANLNVGSLGKAKVGGNLVGSDVRATGSITSLTAGGLRDSRVFAGVRPDESGLPATDADFADGSAQIKALSVKARDLSAVANVLVAAPILGKVSFGGVTSGNGGTPFGLAADRIASLRTTTAAGPLSLARLDAPTDSVTVEDFLVRLL